MENNALEIEKQVAENESKDYEKAFEKLVEAVGKLDELGEFKEVTLELDENMKLGLELAGIKKTETCKKVSEDALSMKGLAYHQSSSPPNIITTPVKDYILSRNRDNESSSRRVNNVLSFEDDCHKSTEVVDLCDSKTEESREKESADAVDTLEERSSGENYEDEDVEATSNSLSGLKRKRVITSDSENDDEDEDNIPIAILNKMKPPNNQTIMEGFGSSSMLDKLEENLGIITANRTTDDELVITHLGDCIGLMTREKESADAMDTLEERSSGENYEDEDVEDTSTSLSGLKRKRVITSDSENDDEDEDNTPISILLKKMKPANQEMQESVDTPTTEENMSGRVETQRRVSSRLKQQRVPIQIPASSERNSTERLVGISTAGNAEDDETDEELGSENESLDGFIVDDDSHETDSEKSDEICEEEADVETSYVDVMSRLRRDKKPNKRRWEYEADMLADFAKDPELCMRAVCVLYRFQTEDEKMSSSSQVCNGRGFNKYDATRGTRIGKFLTDGDPEGDLKKSVEELKSFEFEAVEICRALADRYSKQLFQIYNNREDAFFTLPPSP